MGHAPAPDSCTTEWTGQVQMDSSRTGIKFILQIGQLPGTDSTTSGCIGHVIETGGCPDEAAGGSRRCAPRPRGVSAAPKSSPINNEAISRKASTVIPSNFAIVRFP